MGKENVAMGTKTLSTGDKMLRLIKGVEFGALVNSVLEQGIKDNGFYE